MGWYLFWTGVAASVLVPVLLPWWLFARSPLAAGELGNRERLSTYGITMYSKPSIVAIELLCALPGIVVSELALLLLGSCLKDALVVAGLPALLALSFAVIWFEIREANLAGMNPMG